MRLDTLRRSFEPVMEGALREEYAWDGCENPRLHRRNKALLGVEACWIYSLRAMFEGPRPERSTRTVRLHCESLYRKRTGSHRGFIGSDAAMGLRNGLR